MEGAVCETECRKFSPRKRIKFMKKKRFQIGVAFLFTGIASATPTETDGVKMGSTSVVPAGSNSIAAGSNNHVTDSSLALGDSNISEHRSIAVGDGNTASWGSISSGGWNIVDANSVYSIAAGEGNIHGYNEGTALMGAYNTMSLQFGSAAIGNSNSLNSSFGKWGSGNILIGQLNSITQNVPSAPADLQGTVLIGVGNESSSSMAFAFGRGNIAQTDTVTVGTYAATVSEASLIVGNASSESARSNGLVVLRNGEVQITGSLVVGGSPILTQGAASSFMQGQGFVNTSYLSSNGYLKKANGANASAGTNAFFAIGNNAHATEQSSLAMGDFANATSGGAIALGDQSNASKPHAVALNGGQADGDYAFAGAWGFAGGQYSVALASGWAFADNAIAIGGYDEMASWANESEGIGSVTIGGATNAAIGDYSYAFGWNSVTVGKHSYSMGYGTRTNAYQISMGSRNLSSQNNMPHMSNDQWVEEGALFELGNGNPNQTNPIVASNAITTLKNGRTTLTNKEWKANSTAPLADPASTTDSGGEALVVEGHTRLKGKVVIEQPQGDISMGNYQ